MNIEAIAIDLDGTLLTHDKKITPYSLSILQKAMEKGIKVIVATGRSLATCERFVNEIGVQDPIICYNGSCIYDTLSQKDLFHQPMSEEMCKEIISLVGTTKASLQAFRHHKVYYTKDAKNADFLEPLTSSIGVIVEDFSSISPLEFTKAMYIGELEETEKIKEHLRQKFGESIHLVYSHPTYFEMLSKGATKGFALEKLLSSYNIDPKNTMAFGDESNDLEMLSLVGHPIAMGNGVPQVKEIARYIADSCDNDGVAKAIEKWVL